MESINSLRDQDDALSSLLSYHVANRLIRAHVSRLAEPAGLTSTAFDFGDASADHVLAVGLAAFHAFLQANVTGPVLPSAASSRVESLFADAWADASRGDDDSDRVGALHRLRRASLAYLEVDGVSPYAHIPHIELFSLARDVVVHVLAAETRDIFHVPSRCSLAWTRLRLDAWHYNIITQPSLGHGSNFNKSSQWIEVPSLADRILQAITRLRATLLDNDDQGWTKEDRALFLLETASSYIFLGQNQKAKDAVDEAVAVTGFAYALSGALGKRTKFQDRDISQLVVLARSGAGNPVSDSPNRDVKPDALQLNDDTLLEEIHFTKETQQEGAQIPPALADISPDNQPQLDALDEIILLTEATIKDAFSPIDGLTSEQILPFAVRVIKDASVNWQIYTQALLVRSRIEIHRSRTVERGVLQLQAVADQVIADTTYSASTSNEETSNVPAIRVSAPGEAAPVDESRPTTFLPAPKASESAPAHVRLRYVHALSSPPRWHLESELAYAWAGVGSMASALEIFKRLRLWAEVALCLASSAAATSQDEDGRGSGGEEKAKGIIRWRLFSRTNSPPSSADPEDEILGQDVTLLKGGDWSGPERSPPPPDAPRLWCILGDLEDDPAHYERAWEISKHRFARAQRSLGEHHIQKKQWEKALEAYKLATRVNRMSPDMWGRQGDISLRLGLFEEAAEAFTRSIASASDAAGGEGARTWSNLGSALWSLYLEKTKTQTQQDEGAGGEEGKLLGQALSAFKRGASIAHDNWRIWDNVLTLAARIRPLPVSDILLSLTHIIRIRKSEDALDPPLLSALISDVVLSKPRAEPSRGSPERAVITLVEEQVVPLITRRAELWALVSRLRSWRGDHAGSLDASERAWRAAVGSSAGLSPADGVTEWDAEAWEDVVKRTDDLVSMLETWGPDVPSIGARWKGKARSAVRSVMGRGRENYEGSDGWVILENIMDNLKA